MKAVTAGGSIPVRKRGEAPLAPRFKPGCMVFHSAERNYKTHRPKGDTFPSEPSYNMFGRGRLEDLSLLDLSPLQHEHAFGIMVIGAIEDIPLNPV